MAGGTTALQVVVKSNTENESMADETLFLGMKLGDFLISFGTLLTALFTFAVAGFTYKSAKEINKTVLAQIVFKIREQFDSNEIKESIKILKSVEDEI